MGWCSGSNDVSSLNLNMKALYLFTAFVSALSQHRISTAFTTEKTLLLPPPQLDAAFSATLIVPSLMGLLKRGTGWSSA